MCSARDRVPQSVTFQPWRRGGGGQCTRAQGLTLAPTTPQAPSTPAPLIATKYAPQPWRFTADSVPDACRASLKRLQLEKMALYIQHWPGEGSNTHTHVLDLMPATEHVAGP